MYLENYIFNQVKHQTKEDSSQGLAGTKSIFVDTTHYLSNLFHQINDICVSDKRKGILKTSAISNVLG